jgi:hypothetical protein
MSTVYFVHSAKGEGAPVGTAPHPTMEEALEEAEFELSRGTAFVWIVDGQGHLVLPPSQIKARLAQSASAP